ncbi:MAG: ribosomal protein S18-alanine N-acetyltransferase [Firmicutes bacterium]|nr:ribosomal protein S18-alanine N-acetyltransferase [Bacillota bacterium]
MRTETAIRRMTSDDIEEVLMIEEACFKDPWSKEAFESEMSGLNPCVYFVAVNQGKICGYMGIWHILDEGHVTNVAVHPDFRGQGIGRMLVETTVSDGISKGLNAFTLEVRKSNDTAQELYKKCGFESVGIRKRYYADNEDALIMWRRI